MNIPSEQTSGREEARQALAQSKRNTRESDSVFNNATLVLERLRSVTERPDALADNLRQIIQGGHS